MKTTQQASVCLNETALMELINGAVKTCRQSLSGEPFPGKVNLKDALSGLEAGLGQMVVNCHAFIARLNGMSPQGAQAELTRLLRTQTDRMHTLGKFLKVTSGKPPLYRKFFAALFDAVYEAWQAKQPKPQYADKAMKALIAAAGKINSPAKSELVAGKSIDQVLDDLLGGLEVLCKGLHELVANIDNLSNQAAHDQLVAAFEDLDIDRLAKRVSDFLLIAGGKTGGTQRVFAALQSLHAAAE